MFLSGIKVMSTSSGFAQRQGRDSALVCFGCVSISSYVGCRLHDSPGLFYAIPKRPTFLRFLYFGVA